MAGADLETDGRALAVLDWNGDGAQDLVLHNRGGPRLELLLNRAGSAGHWFSLELRGDGEHVNRDAIGARATIRVGEHVQAATVRAGEGYLAQSSTRLHFGLGPARAVDELTVRWPDGTRSVLHGLEADRRWLLSYGDDGARGVGETEASTVPGETSSSPTSPATGKAPRIVLAEPLPLGELRLPLYDGSASALRDLAPGPTLVTLWSRTCPNCMKEFIERRKNRDRLAELGATLVLLNADEPADKDASLRMLGHYDQPVARAGSADAAFRSLLLGVLLPNLVGEGASRALVTPTSLLFDGDGNLLVLYLGSVPFERLKRDLALAGSDDAAEISERLAGGVRLVPLRRDLSGLVEAARARGFDVLATAWSERDAR